MEGPSNFEKAKKVVYKAVNAAVFAGLIGALPQAVEGQSNPNETKDLRAKAEQTIIRQMEEKGLGMVGTINMIKARRLEEGGRIVHVGYDVQDKPRWMMTSQGDSLVFVDRNLDGDPDRIVIDKEHKGEVGLAFDEMLVLEDDIKGVVEEADVKASLMPEQKKY